MRHLASNLLIAALAAVTATGCSFDRNAAGADPDGGSDPVADAGPDAGPDGTCSAGADGLDCLFALYDEVVTGCDPDRLAALAASIDARHGSLPAWQDGRALFASHDRSLAIAGDWNGWSTEASPTVQICGSSLYLADVAIPSGRYPYKVVAGDTWSLDPDNWAFTYDDFAGNPDGKNSVVDTYDSGLGHLVQPDQPVCSDALGGCRPLTVYLPPGYDAPTSATRRYPVIFMHDGQNIFDDHDCCFGHSGWEVNVTLDQGIAAGEIGDVVIVGADHGGDQRLAEYGGALTDEFIAFQVDVVQPAAAARFRLDPARVYTAGSSLGGLISFRLAWAHPEIYAGAASLSGSFWYDASGQTMSQVAVSDGYRDVALYLDHGGTDADLGDNLESNQALVSQLAGLGFQVADSPDCSAAPGALCYFHDVGATHDEAHWRARAWRFLSFFAPPPGD
jgi:enterochelin esterase-like enzyme